MKSTTDNKTKQLGVHSGHRQRMRDRFIKSGLDSFEQHEILELLLFFGIPYKDTNVLAHNLIEKYGSFSAVFDAPLESLKEVSGMTESAAVLIKALPSISSEYMKDKLKNTVYLGSFHACSAFLKSLFFSSTKEELYVMFLDNSFKLISYKKLATGSVNSIPMTVRQIQEAVFYSNSTNIVMAHNHPSGIVEPSNEDKHMTKHLIESLSYIEVNLLDHVIVAGNNYFSFSRTGLLQECKANCTKEFMSKFAESNKKWQED